MEQIHLVRTSFMISPMFQDYSHLNDQFSVVFPVNPDILRHRRSQATELEHRAGAVGTLGGHDDVTGVLDGNDDASLEPRSQVGSW